MLKTEALAVALGVQPQTLRVAHCRDGHYFGFRPVKLPNGRLSWPEEARDGILRGEVGPAAARSAEPLAA
jgi:hypothetical protein